VHAFKFSSSTCCRFFLFCRRFIRRSTRHTNNGGAINVMTAVFPIIYKDASSRRNTRTPIVLSMLKIAVVIDHVTLNEVKRYDLLWVSTGASAQARIMMMGSFALYSRVDANHPFWSSYQPRRSIAHLGCYLRVRAE
jgi:hypothetical protein